MTRRRPGASGARIVRHRIALTVIATVLLLAGCGSAQPTVAPTASPQPSVMPGDSPAPATQPPLPSETPAVTDSPEPAPSEPPASPPPSAAPEPPSEPPPDPTAEPPATADSCSGTPENQAFYAAVAAAVDWSVYCPVLPTGWFVQSGQYRLADHGRLEISYRGPAGAGLMLQEGAFCPGEDCVPAGDEIGDVAFGDRHGTLLRTADGWAVTVDRGEPASWLLRLSGVGESEARTIAAAMIRVDG